MTFSGDSKWQGFSASVLQRLKRRKIAIEKSTMTSGRSEETLDAPTPVSVPQLNINAQQKLEIDRLRRELDTTRAELARVTSSLQSKELVRPSVRLSVCPSGYGSYSKRLSSPSFATREHS